MRRRPAPQPSGGSRCHQRRWQRAGDGVGPARNRRDCDDSDRVDLVRGLRLRRADTWPARQLTWLLCLVCCSAGSLDGARSRAGCAHPTSVVSRVSQACRPSRTCSLRLAARTAPCGLGRATSGLRWVRLRRVWLPPGRAMTLGLSESPPCSRWSSVEQALSLRTPEGVSATTVCLMKPSADADGEDGGADGATPSKLDVQAAVGFSNGLLRAYSLSSPSPVFEVRTVGDSSGAGCFSIAPPTPPADRQHSPPTPPANTALSLTSCRRIPTAVR